MKPYRDPFGNNLTKRDVTTACQIVIVGNTTSPMALTRGTQWGIGKASRLLKVLEDAGVVKAGPDGKRQIILRTLDGAINAALRQLKKGKK